jgi:hypothetical protein
MHLCKTGCEVVNKERVPCQPVETLRDDGSHNESKDLFDAMHPLGLALTMSKETALAMADTITRESESRFFTESSWTETIFERKIILRKQGASFTITLEKV